MTSTSPQIESALQNMMKLYLDQNYLAFHELMQKISPQQANLLFTEMLTYFEKQNRPVEMMALGRRMASYSQFRNLFKPAPTVHNQSVYFLNQAGLKTRVALSFFAHESLKNLEIDYGYQAFDAAGQICFEGEGRLFGMQTVTFEIEELLQKHNKVAPFGTFRVQTAYKDLMSLRIYAQWYNDVGMCTTHEKGALANASDVITYPTILAQDHLETYLLVGGTDVQKPVTVEAFLFRDDGTSHADLAGFHVPAQGAVKIPVSKCFRDIQGFLQGRAGTILLKVNPAAAAMYYYAIYDKVKNTWQIQHA